MNFSQLSLSRKLALIPLLRIPVLPFVVYSALNNSLDIFFIDILGT